MWLLAVFPGAAAADDSERFLAASAGAFDIFDDQTAAEGRVEYWSDYVLLDLWGAGDVRPFAGVMFTSDWAAYGYAGVRVGFPLGDRWAFTFSFAPGAFDKGDGKDLGYGLEFRSQVEMNYRLANGARLGLAFSHMSNASLGRGNPGAESLVLTYALPFSGLLGD